MAIDQCWQMQKEPKRKEREIKTPRTDIWTQHVDMGAVRADLNLNCSVAFKYWQLQWRPSLLDFADWAQSGALRGGAVQRTPCHYQDEEVSNFQP